VKRSSEIEQLKNHFPKTATKVANAQGEPSFSPQ